jgi:hypothetical protein
LRPGGTLLVLVPQDEDLYCLLDEAMGHRRRFMQEDLVEFLEQSGFQIERTYSLNKIGALSWRIFGKLLGRKQISKPALKLFDKTVWFWRRVDGILPWRGLSLVVVAKRVQDSV